MVRRIDEGFILPRFYGVAWVDYMRHQAVCLPIPFNVLAGLAREVWFWLKYDYRPKGTSMREAYEQGFRDARNATKLDG